MELIHFLLQQCREAKKSFSKMGFEVISKNFSTVSSIELGTNILTKSASRNLIRIHVYARLPFEIF